jgi:hypothetical protein
MFLNRWRCPGGPVHGVRRAARACSADASRDASGREHVLWLAGSIETLPGTNPWRLQLRRNSETIIQGMFKQYLT